MQNNFIGFGPVHVFNGGMFRTKNNYGDVDDALTCEFLAYSDVQPEDDSEVTCTDFDAATCKADIDADLIPPPEPTPQPVAAPTIPSSAPNTDSSSPTVSSSGAGWRRTWTVITATSVLIVALYWW